VLSSSAGNNLKPPGEGRGENFIGGGRFLHGKRGFLFQPRKKGLRSVGRRERVTYCAKEHAYAIKRVMCIQWKENFCLSLQLWGERKPPVYSGKGKN